MKTKLYFLIASIVMLSANAQTTHHLDWAMGMGTNVDLTIVSGDTVMWTWTSPNHTVENTPGSSVETFNSGFLGPVGSTYSYTFTVVGDNHYFCGVHGAGNMSGTITVEENLGIGESGERFFKINSNPATETLTIGFAQNLSNGQLTMYDLLGKQILVKDFSNLQLLEVNISSFERGLYLISIESEGRKQTERFIKN